MAEVTLLENVQNVADEAGYTVAATVVGSTDTTTKQLLAIANRINDEIAQEYPWTQLYAAGSITLVAGQASYALPSAFSWYHYDTFWNQSTRWRVLGPMSPQEYAEIKGYGLNTTVYSRFQLRGISQNEVLISPTPDAGTAGQTIIFEYMMDRSVRPKTWAPATAFGPGSYCSYNGNYYKTVVGGTSGYTPPTWTTGSGNDGGVAWDYYNGSYTKFLADTDVTLFNPKTLELGMLERFAEIHGLTTVVPRYQAELNKDFSRNIPGKTIWAGGESQATLFARSGTAIFGTWI